MYLTIFEEIVQTMHQDYAGYQDKKGWDQPLLFQQQIANIDESDSESRGTFVEIVKDYLVDFHDNHIFFSQTGTQQEPRKEIGFAVRRYHDELYITDVSNDGRVQNGWSITAVDGKTILHMRDQYDRYLNENHAEREKWGPILAKASSCTVKKKDGSEMELSLIKAEKRIYTPEYSVKEIEEGIYLIKMTDFMNPDAVSDLVKKHQKELSSSKGLIFDVRLNLGGNDSSYYPLFPFIFSKEGTELAPDSNDGMLFNCTVNNSERQLKSMEGEEDQIESEEARAILHFFQQQWMNNRGRGFVEFPFEEIMPETFIKGSDLPEKIVVLTDVYCGSSGDSFVEVCKKSPKIKVVGRATMGLNDYANLTSLIFREGFELHYPTSKLMRVDRGEGMTKKGIQPDIYIPWTPEHIERDVDLETALTFIQKGDPIC